MRFCTVARSIRPQSLGVLSNLGVALYGKGQLDEAIACFRKAIALDSKYALAHRNLGHALARQGRFAESLSDPPTGPRCGNAP